MLPSFCPLLTWLTLLSATGHRTSTELSLCIIWCVALGSKTTTTLLNLSPQPIILFIIWYKKIKWQKNQYKRFCVVMKAQLETTQRAEAQTWWIMRERAFYLNAKRASKSEFAASPSNVINSLTHRCITFGEPYRLCHKWLREPSEEGVLALLRYWIGPS